MSFGPRSGPPKAAEVSSSTRDLLDSMMQNKNMSRRLKGDILKSLQSGSADWIEHWSSGKATSRLTESQKWSRRALPQVGREKKTRELVLRLHGDAVSKSGKKSSKDIEASGVLEREEYTGQGVRGTDRDQMKRELQDTCQFAHLTPQERREAKERASRRHAQKRAAAAPEGPTEAERRDTLIDQLLDEISERQDFLNEMRALGKGEQYEAQMKAEVSARLHQLRQLGVA